MKGSARISSSNLSGGRLTVREAGRLMALSLALLFATASAAEEAAPATAETKDKVPSYIHDIQPLFNKRCVACHAVSAPRAI